MGRTASDFARSWGASRPAGVPSVRTAGAPAKWMGKARPEAVPAALHEAG